MQAIFYISTNHFLPFWGDAVAMETVYSDRYHMDFDAIIKVSFFQTEKSIKIYYMTQALSFLR